MIILAYSDGRGLTASKLQDAVIQKANELNIKPILFPENGIHPQFQTDIIDKFIFSKEDLIIATHSELFLLRAIRRYENKDIEHNELVITQYIQSVNSTPTKCFWRDLDYDEDGLIDQFNGGMFEQGYEERFEINQL